MHTIRVAQPAHLPDRPGFRPQRRMPQRQRPRTTICRAIQNLPLTCILEARWQQVSDPCRSSCMCALHRVWLNGKTVSDSIQLQLMSDGKAGQVRWKAGQVGTYPSCSFEVSHSVGPWPSCLCTYSPAFVLLTTDLVALLFKTRQMHACAQAVVLVEVDPASA